VKYFVVSWSAEIEFFVGKYCERISWNIFLERLLLASKSFSTFGNIVSQEYIGLKFLGNNYTISNRVILEKGIILTHRFYFLIVQAFLFLMEKYYGECLHGFIYENFTNVFHHRFFRIIKSVSLIKKRKLSLCECVWELS